jgi:hypothetical protein
MPDTTCSKERVQSDVPYLGANSLTSTTTQFLPAHNGSVSCWWGLAGWFSITVPAFECGLLSVLPPAGRAGPAGVA